MESKTNIFALDSLFADRIKSYSNKGLNFQSFKNISLSALGSFKQSVLILGNSKISYGINIFICQKCLILEFIYNVNYHI